MTVNLEPEALLAGLYEAAALPERWGPALADLALFTSSKTSHIFDWDPAIGGGTWGAVGAPPGAGVSPEADEVYRTHYGAIDPRRPLFQSTLGTVWSCAEAMADTIVPNAAEVYNDFLVPNGVRWTMCVTTMLPETGRLLTLASLRGVADGAYGEEEKRRLFYMAPHIAHIYRVRNRLAEVGESVASACAAWDRAAFGVIVCDADGGICYANLAATRAAANGGLRLSEGRVGADRPEIASELLWRIRAAATPAPSANCGVGHALRIDRRIDLGNLFILISPLPAETAPDGIPARPAALLFVELGTSTDGPLGRNLIEWFGLTGAEARLAVDLLRGSPIDEIADARSLRVSTLRTQLSELLAKTGTKRQVELIALLSRLPRSAPGR